MVGRTRTGVLTPGYFEPSNFPSHVSRLFWISFPFRSPPSIEFPMLYSRFSLVIYFIHSSVYIGEGNGNPLQCSCLENPRDGGAWWAAIYGVAQSRTRLSNLAAAVFICQSQSPNPSHSPSLLGSHVCSLHLCLCFCFANKFIYTIFLGFSGVSDDRETVCDAEDRGLISGLGRSRPRRDLPEKGMATHSSILAWRTPWTEDPGGLYPLELQRVR